MLAKYCRALSRLPHIFSLILLTAALSLHAQTIPNVTGTITSSESFSQYGFLPGLSLKLQASGFSLDASIGSDNLNKFSGNASAPIPSPRATGLTVDRSETITLTDASSGIILDTESSYNMKGGGYYMSWLISGNILVTVTPSGFSSPVVSGIFLN